MSIMFSSGRCAPSSIPAPNEEPSLPGWLLVIITRQSQTNGCQRMMTMQCHSLRVWTICSTDHETLERIDVIFIAVPHDLHERLALQALQHDGGGSNNHEYHVVLEKPLSITVDSCARLVRASRESHGRMLLVAEQSPYWPEVIRARQLLQEEGAIGSQIVTAAAYYYESMRDNVTSGSVDAAGGSLGWRGELARAGGGIALDGGLHWLRPLREICGGRVARVVGVVRHGLAPALRLEGESVGHALLEMEPPVFRPHRQLRGSNHRPTRRVP